jgi:VanZ family protein
VRKQIENVAYFLPFGLLLSGLPGARWRGPEGWRWALAVGLGLAGLIEFMKLFVLSRHCEASDVVNGGLAVLAGWAVGRALARGDTDGHDRGPLAAGLALWAAALVFINWHPFDFGVSPGEALARLRRVSLVPFTDYWEGDYLKALDQAASRVLLFLPLGALLPRVLGFEGDRRAGLWVVLAGAAFAAGIEVGQAFLATRYPSLTDTCVETLGVAVGRWVAVRLRPPAPGWCAGAGG